MRWIRLMAYTADDLALVRAARLRGIRSVAFADRTVTYSSDAEMRQVEEDISRSLAASSTSARPKQIYGAGVKGF